MSSKVLSFDTGRLLKRVLHIRNVARVNSSGKVRSCSAMVVVGDQHGNAGVGMGRGPDTPSAIRKATEIAQKKMVFVPRLDNRTIYSDVNMKFHNVNIELRSAKPGHGLVANNYIHEICRCAGIADLTAKVRGSLNPMNVVNATFAALLNQQNPQKIAQQRGKKLIDVEKTYYGSRL